MVLDLKRIESQIFSQTGFKFDYMSGQDVDGLSWIDLVPSSHHESETFKIKALLGWRRLDIYFIPGRFSSGLLEAISSANAYARNQYLSVLNLCVRNGADIDFKVNGIPYGIFDETVWGIEWKSLEIAMRVGMIEVFRDDSSFNIELVEEWLSRFVVAALSILPLEDDEGLNYIEDVVGYPEGAKLTVQVNKYERDRRNRMAALAIHGFKCFACGYSMSDIYGDIGLGLIEVHHLIPVSSMGDNYIVDPNLDLVPLCPNCHAIAHRKNPPYTVSEVKMSIKLKKIEA